MLSIREFARRDGCDEKLVRKALRTGHLRKATGDKLDAAQVGTGWRATNRRGAASPVTGVRTPRTVRTMSALVPRQASSLAVVATGVMLDAAELLLPHLPRATLEPLLHELVARTCRAAAEVLEMHGVAPPTGFSSWADHPAFHDLPMAEDDWAAIAEEAGLPPTLPLAVAAERLAAEAAQAPPLAESEARKEHYLALLRQLEYEQRVGLMLSIADVEAVVGKVLDTTRTRLLALPTRAAPLLAGKAQPTEVFAVLTRLLHDALDELAATEVVVERIKGRAGA